MKLHIVHATTTIVTAVAWGIWCGGDLTKFLGISPLGIVGASALLVISTLVHKHTMGKFFLLGGTIIAIAVGWNLGHRYALSAFNECVNRGEVVRDELARFKDRSGRYPDDLSALEMNLPGQRLLRGNILNYQKTDKGYDIRFQDWLVTHTADEESGFCAQK